MRKLTVIYNKRWQSGSHWHCLTKTERIEVASNQPLMPQVIALVGSEDICFIYKGWPEHVGE